LNSDLFWAFGPILGLFDAINGFADVSIMFFRCFGSKMSWKLSF
jgi:hypothetical protein